MTFSEIVTTWIDLHEGGAENEAVDNLAREFEITQSTVRRWGT